MLRCFILFLFFTSISAFSQKITIDPSLKVKYSDFKIDWPGNNQDNKPYQANLQIDMIRQDTLYISVTNRSWTVFGLRLTIIKGKASPEFVYVNDGGGITTLYPFESYELILNATNYKLGSIVKGKFTGKVKFKGALLTLSGCFIHKIEDSPNKEARLLKEGSKRKVLKTGFYYTTGTIGEKYGLPKYKLDDGKEFFVETDSIITLSSFKVADAEKDKEKEGFYKVKFLIDDDSVERWKSIISRPFPYVFILDYKVFYYGSRFRLENGFIIIDVSQKTIKDINKEVQKINKAIARARE